MIPIKAYPKEILIGETVWRVRFVRKFRGEPNTVGLCCEANETIYIRQGLGRVETFKTFLHELLHAVEFEHKIEIPHKLIYQLELPLTLLIFQNLAA